MKKLDIILKEHGIEKENADNLIKAFGAPFTEAGEILKNYTAIKVADEQDKKTMLLARDKRLALKKVRTTVENKRKELKADYLKTGKAIDTVAKLVKDTILPAEEYLQSQEDYAKLLAEKRLLEKRTKRLEELSKHTDDIEMYSWEAMTDEAFDALIERLKEENIAKAKLEAEARAKEEAEERQRQQEIKERQERERKEREALEERNRILEAKAEAEMKANERKLARVNSITALGLAWEADKEAYILASNIITKKEILELNDVKFAIRISEIKKVMEVEQLKIKAQEEAKAKLESEARAKAEAEMKAREAEIKAKEAKVKAEETRLKAEKQSTGALEILKNFIKENDVKDKEDIYLLEMEATGTLADMAVAEGLIAK